MNSDNTNKKYKRPKRRTLSTTNPQASKETNKSNETNSPKPRCPLLAKDSQWLDGFQPSTGESSKTTDNDSIEEEVLQLVECEDGPDMKPLTIMFPGLLEEDLQTLEGILNKTMSTTEVTKHLLGQKADFSLMKKVNRLIPNDKKWLDTVAENSDSVSSAMNIIKSSHTPSDGHNGSVGSNNTKKSEINFTASYDAGASSSQNTLH